jgi:hypothetical protein
LALRLRDSWGTEVRGWWNEVRAAWSSLALGGAGLIFLIKLFRAAICSLQQQQQQQQQPQPQPQQQPQQQQQHCLLATTCSTWP